MTELLEQIGTPDSSKDVNLEEEKVEAKFVMNIELISMLAEVVME